MADGLGSSLSVTRSVLGTNQAAGIEVSEVVPEGKQWHLLAATVSLVQGITQEPQPILTIDDGTNVVYTSFGASTKQAVSTTQRYTWGIGLGLTVAGATPNIISTAPLPGRLILAAGWRIKTSTVGIGANTDYGAPTLLVIEYG